MPCYHPIAGWYSTTRTPGGRPVTFRLGDGYRDRPLDIPCGQCIGCRIDRANAWTTRLLNEAQLHDHSIFATLTYDDDHLPENASLRPQDMVLFLKRLREAYDESTIRYFQCGEYGDSFGRPHHHALLFGLSPHDGRLLPNRGPSPLYHSDHLEQLWRQGSVTYGAVTRQSAAYVARYSLKRVTGERAQQHYQGRIPEYATMSRRPGIGARWLTTYANDLRNGLYVQADGHKTKIPRYYLDQLRDNRPRLWARIKQLKKEAAAAHTEPGTRRRIHEECKKAAERRTEQRRTTLKE